MDENFIKAQEELVEDVFSFLDAFCHHALYCFRVYPSGIFQKRLKFGAVAFKTIHPELHNYIAKCTNSLKPLLQRNLLSAIEIVFIGKMAEVLSKLTLVVKTGRQHCVFDDQSRLQLHKTFQKILLQLSQSIENRTLSKDAESFRLNIIPSTSITNSQLLELQNQSFRFLDISADEERANVSSTLVSSALTKSSCEHLSFSVVISIVKPVATT